MLAFGVALVVAVLALEMSGRAARSAGSDHVAPSSFVVAVPGGGVLCQRISLLPSDAPRVQLVVETDRGSLPDLHLRFRDLGDGLVAAGQLPAGLPAGRVTMPLTHVTGAHAARSFCLRVGGSSRVLLAGEKGTLQLLSRVNGRLTPGAISLLYLRHGEESWWQLLGPLDRRFGLGKAAFLGDWTLPAVALLLVLVWVATARLLVRELT
jgi:hypothetical protein